MTGSLACGHLRVTDHDFRRYGFGGAAALHYADAFGWDMHPLVWFRNTPLLMNWQDLATSDPNQIRAWALEFPGCGWGHRTGRGWLVADLDVKHGDDGPAELLAFMAEHGLSLPYVPFAISPSGGPHLQMRLSEEVPSRSNAARIIPGVDLLADGGFCATAPPSWRLVTPLDRPGEQAGGDPIPVPYRWADGCCPCQAPMAPAWLIEAMRTMPSIGRPGGGAGGGIGGPVPDLDEVTRTGIPVGQRNRSLYTLACSRFRVHGTTPGGVAAVTQEIRSVWEAGDQAGSPWPGISRSIESARRFISGEEQKEKAMLQMTREWLR